MPPLKSDAAGLHVAVGEREQAVHEPPPGFKSRDLDEEVRDAAPGFLVPIGDPFRLARRVDRA